MGIAINTTKNDLATFFGCVKIRVPNKPKFQPIYTFMAQMRMIAIRVKAPDILMITSYQDEKISSDSHDITISTVAVAKVKEILSRRTRTI